MTDPIVAALKVNPKPVLVADPPTDESLKARAMVVRGEGRWC